MNLMQQTGGDRKSGRWIRLQVTGRSVFTTTAWGRRTWSLSRRLVRRGLTVAPGLVVIGGLLGLWELAAKRGIVNSLILPAPSDIGTAGWDLFKTGELTQDALTSLKRVLIGSGIAAGVGMTAGIALGSSTILRRAFLPVIEVLRPIPPIAWIPVAILWFGVGNPPAYFIVFLAAVFPMFLNTFIAIRNVEPIHIDAARTLGARWIMILFRVKLPAGLPYILTGLRIGIGIGWMAVVAAELIAARSGLGYRIEISQQLLRTDLVLVGMISIGILGVAMNQAMLILERILAPWSRDVDRRQ